MNKLIKKRTIKKEVRQKKKKTKGITEQELKRRISQEEKSLKELCIKYKLPIPESEIELKNILLSSTKQNNTLHRNIAIMVLKIIGLKRQLNKLN